MSESPPPACHPESPCIGPPLSGGAGAEPLRPPQRPLHLDTLQTSSPDPVTISNYAFYRDCLQHDQQPFEHTGWHNVRMNVLNAMEATNVPISRAAKFVGCGDEIFIYENTATGEVDYHSNRCGDRFCMICGQARSRRITHALAGLIEKEEPLFITLTVRGKPGDTLASMIDRLTDAWKQLRRLDHWKERVRGGAIMLEIKYSKSSGGHWHPHYHLIAHGKYIEKQWLRDAWRLITRDSDQVDIKRVKEIREALGYVTKYASKPMDGSFTTKPHLLREAMKTLKGRRLCACFGTWYGTPLHDDDEVTDEEIPTFTPWAFAGSRRTLESKAAEGDAHAKDLLSRVERLRALRHAFANRCRGPTENNPFTVGPTPSDAAA